jgi:glycosyltransferase involved in cell wall biosynthesis
MATGSTSRVDPRRPDVSIIVTSFERPHQAQRREGTSIEVVVADDGSRDDTLRVVREFAARAAFSVTFTTHEHRDFWVARSRNNAIALCRGAYLIFVDGDCVLPPDHLDWHLKLKRPGVVVVGDSYRLTERATGELAPIEIDDDHHLLERVSPRQRRHFRLKAVRALAYSLLRVPMRPRLTANNFGIWRDDIERVNGFDEAFIGWGLEDTDLQRRLAMSGRRFASILHRTVAFHLWHPVHPTMRRRGVGTRNYEYYHRRRGDFRCELGIVQPPSGPMTVHRFDGGGESVETADRSRWTGPAPRPSNLPVAA